MHNVGLLIINKTQTQGPLFWNVYALLLIYFETIAALIFNE